MGRVVILGCASAVPDPEHENTHIFIETGSRMVLVDCPGSPTVRLQQAGIDYTRLTDVLLTHFHPDHVSGFAALLMNLWLVGRRHPINVYGLEPTIQRAKRMMDLYDWREWPDFYPVNYVSVPAQERELVLEDDGLRIFSSPVEHLIPTFGLRFELDGKVLVYSCDTQPSRVTERLARGADVLIHEATGESVGHTPPEKAGEIAQRAGVRKLYLIHYPPQLVTPESLLERARQTFSGEVIVTKDFMTIDL